MKPAPFDYQAPGTLREAIDLLAPMAQVVFAVSTLVEAPLIGRSSPDGAAPVPA
jgi:hypothetical protein